MSEAIVCCSTNSNFSSSGSDSSSTGEEERLRQLFLSCDSNQDGRLDSRDLQVMCQKLNMAELADEIVQALGANIKGSISFDEFLICRRKVLQMEDDSPPACDVSGGGNYSAAACSPLPPFIPAAGHTMTGPLARGPLVGRHQKQRGLGPKGTGSDGEDEEEDYAHYAQVGHLHPGRLDSSASDNSLVNSGAEYDSGAQDLSGEPQNLHILLRRTHPDLYKKVYDQQQHHQQQEVGSTLTTSLPTLAYLLDCANALHLTRVTRLKSELRDYSNRLHGLQASREASQREIYRLQRERARLKHEISNQAGRYEDRLTELHSVIAELHKKFDRSATDCHVIREVAEEEEEEAEEQEDGGGTGLAQVDEVEGELEEGEDTETAVHEAMAVAAAAIAGTVPTARHALQSPLLRAPSSGLRPQQQQQQQPPMLPPNSTGDPLASVWEHQIENLLRNQHFLQEKLSGYESVIQTLQGQVSSLIEEKESLRRQLRDIVQQQQEAPTVAPAPVGISGSGVPVPAQQQSGAAATKPVMGLRHQQARQQQQQQQQMQQAPDWIVRVIQRCRSVEEIVNASGSTSVSPIPIGSGTNISGPSQQAQSLLLALAESVPHPLLTDPCRRAALEWERVLAWADRLSADNTLLQVSLEEAKSTSDQLQCRFNQLEANWGAAHRCQMLADYALEITDVLLQLAESELSLMTAACRAAGLPDTVTDLGSTVAGCGSVSPPPPTASHKLATLAGFGGGGRRALCTRRQAESTARQLLTRLEGAEWTGRLTPDSGAGVSSTLSSTTSGGSELAAGGLGECAMWSRTDEMRLRAALEQLNAERMVLRGSLVAVPGTGGPGETYQLQGSLPRSTPLSGSADLVGGGGSGVCSLAQHHQVNQFKPAGTGLPHAPPPPDLLENAVLLQELCCVKEDRAELRGRVYLLEKEVRAALLALESRAAGERALRAQLEVVRSELEMVTRSRTAAGGGAASPYPLPVEVARLRAQVQDLLVALEQVRSSAEVQQQQSEELVIDLKRANLALIGAFEKAKRKYQGRIKKLESQVVHYTTIAAAGTNNNNMSSSATGLEGSGFFLMQPSETAL